MTKPPYSTRSFVLLLSLALVTLACTFLASSPSENTVQPPTPSVNLDNVEIDYLYRSDLISIIYPLYGTILDDFTIVTITNTNDLPVKLMISSEVQGFTTQSVDTVTVDPQSSLEVRQNPRLNSEAFDKLNVEQPAQFRIRVNALQSGEEKILLDESGETLVFARRDFPRNTPRFRK
ncbi:MAG: hypothetical protein ACOY16_10600 [Chloroflexota bacterium]